MNEELNFFDDINRKHYCKVLGITSYTFQFYYEDKDYLQVEQNGDTSRFPPLLVRYSIKRITYSIVIAPITQVKIVKALFGKKEQTFYNIQAMGLNTIREIQYHIKELK